MQRQRLITRCRVAGSDEALAAHLLWLDEMFSEIEDAAVNAAYEAAATHVAEVNAW